MTSLLEKIKAHADPDRVRQIQVEEWGAAAEYDAAGEVVKPAVPLIITYKMVTLDDLAIVTELDGQEWNKRAARIVALKACDKDGARLFNLGDAITLRTVAAPEVVNRIALAMYGRISQADAEKN